MERRTRYPTALGSSIIGECKSLSLSEIKQSGGGDGPFLPYCARVGHLHDPIFSSSQEGWDVGSRGHPSNIPRHLLFVCCGRRAGKLTWTVCDTKVNEPPEDSNAGKCGSMLYFNHYLVGTMSAGNEVGLNRWTEPKPFPFFVHFPRQGLGDTAHLCAGHPSRLRPRYETEHNALPSVNLEQIDFLG